MTKEILGLIISIIGVISTAFGITGGIVKMIKELEDRPKGFSLPLTYIKVLTDFLSSLAKAPTWLALTLLGIFLIAWGGSLLFN